MAILHYARSNKALGTAYIGSVPVREEKSGFGVGDYDMMVAGVPVAQTMALAFDYDSFDGGTDITFYLPANTIVTRALLRVDEAFDAGLTITFGDSSDADGWLATVSAASTGLYGGNGVYNSGAASPGLSGPQMYSGTDVLTLTASAAPTQGKAILLLSVLGYNEELGAEWDLL